MTNLNVKARQVVVLFFGFCSLPVRLLFWDRGDRGAITYMYEGESDTTRVREGEVQQMDLHIPKKILRKKSVLP